MPLEITRQTTTDGSASAEMEGELTLEQLRTLAERTARELLGVSAEDAFAMLDQGELDGTLAGGTLTSLRWLLRAR